jgi:hypothetical protein
MCGVGVPTLPEAFPSCIPRLSLGKESERRSLTIADRSLLPARTSLLPRVDAFTFAPVLMPFNYTGMVAWRHATQHCFFFLKKATQHC